MGTANLPESLELGQVVHLRASTSPHGKILQRLLPCNAAGMELSPSTLHAASPITKVKFQHFLSGDMLALTREERVYTSKEPCVQWQEPG